MNSKEINLSPCPFCGDVLPVLEEVYIYSEYFGYLVRCQDCEAEIEGDTEDEVVTKWNRRDEQEKALREIQHIGLYD